MAKKKKSGVAPSDLYNPTPNEAPELYAPVPVAASPGDFVDPTATPQLSGQTIDVYDPKTQRAYRIPVENIGLAKEAGMIADTPELKGLRKYRREHAGASGAAEAFADRFVSWGSAGVSDVIDEHTLDEYQKAKKEIVLKDHEFAGNVGALLGFLASDLWMGPLIGGAGRALGIGEKGALKAGAAAHTLEAAERAGLVLPEAVAPTSAKAAFEGAVESLPAHVYEEGAAISRRAPWSESVQSAESALSQELAGAYPAPAKGPTTYSPYAAPPPTVPGGFGISPLATEAAEEALPSYLRSSRLDGMFKAALEEARPPSAPMSTMREPFIPGSIPGGPRAFTPEGTLISPQFGRSPMASTLTPGSIQDFGKLLGEGGTLMQGHSPAFLEGAQQIENRLIARRGLTAAEDFQAARLRAPTAAAPSTIPELATIRDIGLSPMAESIPASTMVPGSSTAAFPATRKVPSFAGSAPAEPLSDLVTARGGLASHLGEMPTAPVPTSVLGPGYPAMAATRPLNTLADNFQRPVAEGGFFGLPRKMGPMAVPTLTPDILGQGAHAAENLPISSGVREIAASTVPGVGHVMGPIAPMTPAAELITNPLSSLRSLPRSLPTGDAEAGLASLIDSAEAASHMKALTGGNKVLEEQVVKLAADTLASKVGAGLPEAAAAAVEKAAPSIVRNMLSSGLRMGMEGTAFTAPAAITEAYFGDPKKSGEMLLQSAVLGGLLGSAFGAAKVFSGRVGKALSGELSNTSPRVKGFLLDNVWRSLGEVSSLNSAAKRIGSKAGGVRGVAQELVDNKLVRRPFETFEAYHDRLNGFLDDLMLQKAQKLERLDLAGANPSERAFIKVFSDGIEDLQKKFAHSDLVPKLEELKKEFILKASDAGWSFQKANRFRVDLEDRLRKSYESGNFSEVKAEMRDIARGLNDVLIDQANKEAKRLNMGLVGEGIRKDALKFHRIKVAEEAVEHAATREKNLNQFGLRDHMAGLAGAAMGGGLGAAAAAMAMKVGRHELNPLIGHAMYWLDSRGGNGLTAIEQAYKQVGEKLEKISPMLSGKVIPEFKAAANILPSALLGKYIGDKNLPKDKYKLYDMFVEKLEQLADNPNDVAEAIADPLMRDAPDTAKALAAHLANGITYLSGEVPRNPNPTPNPWIGKYRPTDVELQNFYSKVEVFNDWTSVLGHMSNKSLRTAHVDAMNVMYPEILHDIRKHAFDWMIEPSNQPLPYHTSLMLSILMERRLDPALDIVGSLQSTFNSAQQNSQRPAKIQRHRSAMPNMEDLPSLATETMNITVK